MKKQTRGYNLDEAIQILEEKQAAELLILREQFYITYQSLRPINLIKDTLKDITNTPEIKGSIKDSLIAYTTGYITKNVIIGKTINPIKNIVGVLFQIAVTNVVSKHSKKIRTIGKQLYSLFAK